MREEWWTTWLHKWRAKLMIYQYTVYVKDSKKGSFKKSCWSILKLSYMGRSQGVAYEPNKPLLIASAWPCSKVACSFGPACVCHREIPHVTTPQIWKGSKCEPLTRHYSGIDEFGPMVHMHMHVYIYMCIYVFVCVYSIYSWDYLRFARLPECQKLVQDSAGPRIPRYPKGKVAWCPQKFASTAGFYASIFHIWLVVSTILKNISQWEGLSHILWKIKNVPNHQPDMLPNAICKIERQMLLYSNRPGTYKDVAPKSMVSLGISDQSHDENPPKSSKYLPLTLPTS